MFWGHTDASDLKALGSCGCPHFPYSTKNKLQEKMNQVLLASLFTQDYKSISWEAFKITLPAPTLPFLTGHSPPTAHTQEPELERGTPNPEHTPFIPTSNCSGTTPANRNEDQEQCPPQPLLSDSRNRCYASTVLSLLPSSHCKPNAFPLRR